MSLPEEPAPNRATTRKHDILVTARELFVENGFHATGVALIAKNSGVAMQQLYRDFSSKSEIIAKVAAAECQNLANLGELRRAVDRRDKTLIRACLISAVECSDTSPARLILEILAEAPRNPQVASIFAHARTTACNELSAAFANLAGSAAVDESHRQLAHAYLIVWIGSIYDRALHGRSSKATAAVRSLLSQRQAR